MEDPPGSRLFVVCGKSAEADMLQEAFEVYGNVQYVKMIRDKGVAYVKFDKASSGALAMENLNGAVLNHGRGPKLKVLLADSPNARNSPHTQRQVQLELAFDPDNIPPRSRLFLVVPKTADVQGIKDDVAKHADLEYCKTDLVASKGVVFCKYSKASSALKAMEDICETGTLCGYKVKCMLAEPKSKHPRVDGIVSTCFGTNIQTQLDFTRGGLHLSAPLSARSAIHGDFKIPASPSTLAGSYNGYASYADGAHGPLTPAHAHSEYSGLNTVLQGLSGLNTVGPSLGGMSAGSMTAMGGVTGKMDTVSMPLQVVHQQAATAGGAITGAIGKNITGPVDNPAAMNCRGGMGDYTAVNAGLSPGDSLPALSKQRLFVVVYKGVKEDELARLFRRFPGMEYCDLKKDKKTGKSKGYCYVNYSMHESAKAAIQHLNGLEYPTNSGHRMKVMFAEPLGVRSVTQSPRTGCSGAAAGGGKATENGSLCTATEHCGLSGDVNSAYCNETDGDKSNVSGASTRVSSFFDEEPGDDTKVFTALTRPLPDYAIEHIFTEYGEVEYVRLQRDKRFGVVKLSSAESAQRAIRKLTGTDICGEALTVSTSPILPSRTADQVEGVLR